jgi:tetratricopeptide (TPR) repeat protein
MLRGDSGRGRRQVGLVGMDGESATHTGSGCAPWAGGRAGPGYAIQGNILTSEEVVAAMERSFLATAGKPLAERMLAALRAGDDAGGDSRGRQSAALLVARAGGGYGGLSDRAVDVRVDDHPDPFGELARLVGIALVNDLWNRGWTAFTEGRHTDAVRAQEQAAARAEAQPAILPEVLYDLAVIRLAAGDREGARAALDRALAANPKLAAQAATDADLEGLRLPK